jgi:hypothetical protein
MPAYWPTGLPTGFLAGSETHTYEQPLVFSAMDTGPAKVRRQTTAGVQTLEGTLPPMTQAQLVLFEQFWRGTLRGGSLPFFFMSLFLRFKPGTPPVRTTLRGASELLYTIRIALEVLN